MANPVVFLLFRNWLYVLIFFYGLGFLLTALSFYFYVESPPLEIISHNENPQEAYEAFMRIARRNGVTDHGITEE